MAKSYRLALLSLLLTGCGQLASIISSSDPSKPGLFMTDKIFDITRPSYNFNYPDIIACVPQVYHLYKNDLDKQDIDYFICTTANTDERFTITKQQWLDKKLYLEMFFIDYDSFNKLLAEIKSLCKQDFKPELECANIVKQSETLKLLTKE